MCMSLTRRVQLLLDPVRYERLEQAAAAAGTSVAGVIRQAIDRLLPEHSLAPDRAGKILLEAQEMPAVDWEALKPVVLDEMGEW
jgi:hypothetical protein